MWQPMVESYVRLARTLPVAQAVTQGEIDQLKSDAKELASETSSLKSQLADLKNQRSRLPLLLLPVLVQLILRLRQQRLKTGNLLLRVFDGLYRQGNLLIQQAEGLVPVAQAVTQGEIDQLKSDAKELASAQ